MKVGAWRGAGLSGVTRWPCPYLFQPVIFAIMNARCFRLPIEVDDA